MPAVPDPEPTLGFAFAPDCPEFKEVCSPEEPPTPIEMLCKAATNLQAIQESGNRIFSQCCYKQLLRFCEGQNV